MSDFSDMIAGIGLIIGASGILLILLVWGASVLYRGLDGDRFLVRGRVEGRWVNPVNWRLIILGAGSIGLGWFIVGVGTFAARPETGPAWFVWSLALSGALALTPAAFAWAWVGRRAAGKPRCPKCLYNVAGIKDLTCPECGFAAQTEAFWFKPRKRKRGFVFAALMPLAAAVLIALPFVDRVPWRAAIPTGVLIGRVESLSDTMLGLDYDGYSSRFTPRQGSLLDRLMKGTLSLDELDALGLRIEELATRTRDPRQLLRLLTISTSAGIHVTIAPDEGDFAAWVAGALEPDAGEHLYWFSQNWHHLISIKVPPALPRAERADMIERLLAAMAVGQVDYLHNMVRTLTACVLAGDDQGLLDAIVEAMGEGLTANLFDGQDVNRVSRLTVLPRVMAHAQPERAPERAWARWFEAADADERAVWSAAIVWFSVTLGESNPWSGVQQSASERARAVPLTPAQRKDALDRVLADIASHPQLLAEAGSWQSRSVEALRNLAFVLLAHSDAEALLLEALAQPAAIDRAVALATLEGSTRTPLFRLETLLELAHHEHPPLRAAAVWSLRQELEWSDSNRDLYAEQVLALPKYPENVALIALMRYWMGQEVPDDDDAAGDAAGESP
ncbi:MAG: hypothetical protein KF757_14380 [Phycisphaeraceae bacterium]|nr:hypothetical protein [Phycisphaeraceae bacterium]MCW5762935.1 hypothetical protein [Phycisphaeraceae bacterium]